MSYNPENLKEGIMKNVLVSIFLLTAICTVYYPEGCTVFNTDFKSGQKYYKFQVDCAFDDGTAVTYFGKSERIGKIERIDYVASPDLTDSISISCEKPEAQEL